MGEVRTVRFRCERPSRYVGWLMADGRVVPARCGAPNKCAYCAYQATVENALLIGIDAERAGHPRVGMTLTTVNPQHDPAKFRDDVRLVFRAIRRREPDCEYLGFMEWTTGRGRRSGGVRRVHQHLLLRGVGTDDLEALERVVRDVWQARTGASRVEVRELRSAAGATAYLVHHHRKTEQAPPADFGGKRLRASKGYYSAPVAELRAEVRELLRSKRLRKAARRMIEWEILDGAPEDIIDEELTHALAAARADAANVCFVKLDDAGGIVAARAVGS